MTNRDVSFGEAYASYYDLIYHDKDYDIECEYLQTLFSKYSNAKVRTILDIGCGTGRHSRLLAKRGYTVTGIDLSKPMLARAESEASNERLERVRFFNMDMRKIALPATFDVAVSMFSVISYLLSLNDLSAMLKGVRRHLALGGLFIFDFWNGIAVLNLRPGQRVKVVRKDDLTIVRTVKPEMHLEDQTIENQYHCLVLKGNRLLQEFNETHRLRFYFPEEIKYLLTEAGFVTLDFLPFLGTLPRISDADWNVVGVARAA